MLRRGNDNESLDAILFYDFDFGLVSLAHSGPGHSFQAQRIKDTAAIYTQSASRAWIPLRAGVVPLRLETMMSAGTTAVMPSFLR